jgi:hypothetical protein
VQAGILRLKRKGRVRSCLCYVVDRAQQLFPMMPFRSPKAGTGVLLRRRGRVEDSLQGSSASISS